VEFLSFWPYNNQRCRRIILAIFPQFSFLLLCTDNMYFSIPLFLLWEFSTNYLNIVQLRK
jgi:hypothetical protein